MSGGVIVGVLACAYLLGSIPFGLLVARARGIDVRAVGSGNIGATNVARALGKKTGLVVLLLDAAKAFGPVLLATRRWPERPLLVAGVGLFCILGHVFPIWLKLRGGKGVATALGVFLALAPAATLVAGALFAVVYTTTRIVSLGSLTGATAMPIAMLVFAAPWPFIALGAVAWLLIAIRHQGNIRRLMRREERPL
jgi:glycerol-3-phosphate acyltransferase PlsY